jgi:hypothetical protein
VGLPVVGAQNKDHQRAPRPRDYNQGPLDPKFERFKSGLKVRIFEFFENFGTVRKVSGR